MVVKVFSGLELFPAGEARGEVWPLHHPFGVSLLDVVGQLAGVAEELAALFALGAVHVPVSLQPVLSQLGLGGKRQVRFNSAFAALATAALDAEVAVFLRLGSVSPFVLDIRK